MSEESDSGVERAEHKSAKKVRKPARSTFMLWISFCSRLSLWFAARLQLLYRGLEEFIKSVQEFIEALMGWAFFVTVLLLVYLFWPTVWPWESDKAVNFTLTCSEPYIKRRCPGRETPWRETTYTLNRAANEVVSMSRPEGVAKLVKCTIFDGENWQCEYERFFGEVRMENGLIVRDDLPILQGHYRSVRQWRYQLAMIPEWRRRLQRWLRSLEAEKTK